MKDFAPISQVVRQPYLVVATLSLPVRNMAELIALAKAKPGQVTYASTGLGGSNHLATEIFSNAAGIRMLHVPYKGSSPALADVAGGQVQTMFSSIITGLPLARGGKLRALAVTSSTRMTATGDVPALSETITGFEAIGWYGVVAPGATPRAVINKLHGAIASGMQAPDVKTRLAAEGSEAVSTTPTDFAAFLRNELARFAQAIKTAGVELR